MATATSGAVITIGLTPPTSPLPPLDTKKQVSENPTLARRSSRDTRSTARGAAFKLSSAKKLGNAAVSPSPSPPRDAIGQKPSPEQDAGEDVNGKSHEDSTVSPSPKKKKKTMLIFPRAIVRAVFRSRRSDIVSLPDDVEPVESDVAAKEGTKPTSRAEKGMARKPSSPAAQKHASMIDSELSAAVPIFSPLIGVAGGNEVEKINAEPISSGASKHGISGPSKSVPATQTPEKKKAVTKAPTSKTPAANESATDVSKLAPASKKRGYGTAQPGRDDETDNRPSKSQKLSPPGRRNLMAPELIVASAERTPYQTEATAWLFAYGKEGTQNYLRSKFPDCAFEAYGYGKLDNYKFVLHSDAYAKAIPHDGSEIHGALYKIPEKIREALEKKAGKHGMKYELVPGIQPMHSDPDLDFDPWSAPFIPHAEPLECWMGVCEKLDGNEKLGRAVAEKNFFKRRALSALIMEMEMAGVPQEYFDKYTRMWVPPPRDAFDTGYHNDPKTVKPSKD